MKKPTKTPRKPFKGPAEGGAYVADAKSGHVKRDAFTRPAEWPKAGGAPTAATEDGKPGAPPKGRAADRRPPDDSGAPAQGQSAKRAERPVSETEETKNA